MFAQINYTKNQLKNNLFLCMKGWLKKKLVRQKKWLNFYFSGQVFVALNLNIFLKSQIYFLIFQFFGSLNHNDIFLVEFWLRTKMNPFILYELWSQEMLSKLFLVLIVFTYFSFGLKVTFQKDRVFFKSKLWFFLKVKLSSFSGLFQKNSL